MSLVIISTSETPINPDTTGAIARELATRGISANIVHPQEICYVIRDRSLRMLHAGDDALNWAAGLLVRSTRGAIEQSINLVTAFTALGIPTVERLGDFINPQSKVEGLFRRARTYPSPQTWVCWSQLGLLSIEKDIVFPVLVKPHKGTGGRGITRLNTMDAAVTYAVEHFQSGEPAPVILQQLVDKVHDFRVLVVGQSPVAVIERVPANTTLDAWNIAQGSVPIPIKGRLDLELLAIEVARDERVQFAGIDIVEDADGKLWLLECNRNPNFTACQSAFPDINIAGIIADHLIKTFASH